MTASRSRANRSLNSGHGEPRGADGDLVERLPGADAEHDAAGVEGAEGAERLRDDGRVVAEGRRHDGRAELDPLGALADGGEPATARTGRAACWWRHGWKWSEMKTESSPTCSACAAYVTRSRGPNCSADAFQPTLSTLNPSGRGGVVPPAYGRALSSPSPVDDDLVADADLVVEPDQQRLVAHVDAAVRGAGVAEPGEVRGVVHCLAPGEEHGVRHGRVVEVRDDVDLLVVDGEDAFARGQLVTAEADVEAVLRHAVDDPGEHPRRLADAHDPTRHAALVEVPRGRRGLGLRRLRHDVGELVARRARASWRRACPRWARRAVPVAAKPRLAWKPCTAAVVVDP